MQKEVKRPNQISIKAILFKCDAIWNHFPLNVYKCDAIISKHNMLFQKFYDTRMLSEISGENTDLIWLLCCLIHTCTLVLLLRVSIYVYFIFVTTKHLSIDIFNLHFVYIFIIYKSHFPKIPSIIFYC